MSRTARKKLNLCAGQGSNSFPSWSSVTGSPSAPATYNASAITGTGSSDRAVYTEQHRPRSQCIAVRPGGVKDNPFVPEGLLKYCDERRVESSYGACQKATNLYKRVSRANYRRSGKGRPSGAKCLACRITLAESSRDVRKSGVKIRCECHARVCATCFQSNGDWYLTEPHFTQCPTVRTFVCSVCACFQGSVEKVCCSWMCSGCSSERRESTATCSICASALAASARGTRTLWAKSKTARMAARPAERGVTPGPDSDRERVLGSEKIRAEDEEGATEDYGRLLRERALDRVARTRHLTASDVRTLFPECYAPSPRPDCTCESEGKRNALCARCTPVLTLMRLLARNPRALIASMGELAVPGRALSRTTYDRALLTRMLNDRDLPDCANGRSCKGFLVKSAGDGTLPLPSLISPESYSHFARLKTDAGHVGKIDPCACLLCLLFNQSARVAQMFSAESLHLELHPTGPVYYFNIKLSPDVGVPEVPLEDQPWSVVNFQGAVGSYAPGFFYNWRDMLNLLRREEDGRVSILQVR